MSETKVKKACRYFKITRQAIQQKKSISKPIFISDSKGKYVKAAITTEHALNIDFQTKKGWKIQRAIDWSEKNLVNLCSKHRSVTIYIWLGTCDLTELSATSRYISLARQTDANVRYLKRKFIELKTFIGRNIPNSKVIFLEVPPYSIQRWNRSQGHKTPDIFGDDDQHLQNQLYELNNIIREINQSDKLSPHFDLDLRKNSKRKGGTDEFYNFNLYKYDGVHPNSHLSQLWIRRIATKVLEQCFK